VEEERGNEEDEEGGKKIPEPGWMFTKRSRASTVERLERASSAIATKDALSSIRALGIAAEALETPTDENLVGASEWRNPEPIPASNLTPLATHGRDLAQLSTAGVAVSISIDVVAVDKTGSAGVHGFRCGRNILPIRPSFGSQLAGRATTFL
jgi:hypothetical protein